MTLTPLSTWMRRGHGSVFDTAVQARARTALLLELKSARVSRLRRYRDLLAEHEQAKREGYTHKIWVSRSDGNSRTSHSQADGQIVAIDEFFDVGGEDLFLPSDVRGSYAETANCRCTVRYLRLESEDLFTQVGRRRQPNRPQTPNRRPLSQAEQFRQGEARRLIDRIIELNKGYRQLRSPEHIYTERDLRDLRETLADTRLHYSPIINEADARRVAAKLGYRPTGQFSKGGAAIYKKGRSYISRDLDSHRLSGWKKATSIKNLARKETREGTYNRLLRDRIGD